MYDPGAEATHDQLPPEVASALTATLAAACEAPLAATLPYGLDTPEVRQLVVHGAVAILYLSHATKRLYVTQITPLP